MDMLLRFLILEHLQFVKYLWSVRVLILESMLVAVVVSLVLMELMEIMVAVPLLELLDLLDLLVVEVATDRLVVADRLDLLGNLVVAVSREIIISREHTNRIEVIKEIDEQDANAMEVGPELEEDQNKEEQVIRVVLDSSRDPR